MTGQEKTKDKLIDELRELRNLNKRLEVSKMEIKRAEAKAQSARSFAENVIETIRDPLLVLDEDLKLISANRSFYNTFKVRPKETIGNLIYDLGNRQWDIPRLRILLEDILPKHSHIGGFEVEHDFPTVGHKIMRLNARQIHQELNGEKMILLVAEDITRFKKLERERKDILSMFAHDMKNAVITSEGFLSRLISGKAGVLGKKQQDYLGIILNEFKQLSQFLSDFMELARLEAKEYKPNLAPCNIQAEIQKGIEAVQLKAQKKKITISIEPQVTKLPMINADADKISRVIRNLLDNAIKYTDEGGTITVEMSERSNEILVSFIDTGIGIPEEHLSHIFEAFYRVSRDSKGSGLGLNIAKMIIEGHAGRIWAERAPTKGSIFSFTLPRNRDFHHEENR
jgi:two-component system, cell cycle sensor histidine kinase PleC